MFNKDDEKKDTINNEPVNEEENLDNKNENNDENQDKPKQKDDRSFSEKFEDAVDNVMGDAEDAIYGTNPNFTEDIPATIVNGNDRRVINKVQTRRNFNKKLFSKVGMKRIGIIFLIAIVIGIIVAIVG